MIQRHRNADAVLFGQAHGAADEIAVVENIVVRQRHALGRARGAAGELDIDGIVELQRFGQFRQRLAMPRAAHPRHVLECDRAGRWRPADLDHRAQLRQPRRVQFARRRFGELGQQRVQHLHVVRGLERGRGHDRGAADLGQREFEFAEAIGRIDGDEDDAGFRGGKLRQRPFRPVERPDADPRAALQPQREKAGRQRIDALGEFLPGPADIMARRNQRLAVAPAPHREIEALPDGVAQQRRIGGAANVTGCWFGQVCFSMRKCVAREGVGDRSIPEASLRGAQATKQSILRLRGRDGLLRCARNDDLDSSYDQAAFWPLPASSPA